VDKRNQLDVMIVILVGSGLFKEDGET